MNERVSCMHFFAVLTLSSTKIVYKVNKSASLHPSQIVYKNNSIPRRLSNTGENFEGNNLKQGHCDLPVTESRICYKLKEISSSPNTENRILGNDNRLGGGDSVPVSGEDRVNFQKLSGCIVNSGGVDKRSSKAFGNIIINSISNFSCTTVHEVLEETRNSQPLFEKRLQQQSSSRSTLQGGTKVVDIKAKSFKWEVSNFSPGRILIQSNSSKTGWRGAFCQKTSIVRAWTQAEQALHINILELRATKFAILIFSSYKKDLTVHVQMNNQAVSLFGKNRRDRKPTRASGGKGNMGILSSQSHHTFCRIPVRDFK